MCSLERVLGRRYQYEDPELAFIWRPQLLKGVCGSASAWNCVINLRRERLEATYNSKNPVRIRPSVRN